MNRAGWLATGGLVGGGLVTMIVLPVALAVSTVGAELKEGIVPASCGSTATIQQVSRSLPKVPGYSTVKVGNAATIVQAGEALKVPPRGWVIAVATAMQESNLRNLASDSRRYPTVARLSQAMPHDGTGHDHDSVGLFQQRPNEGDGGWGPVKDLMVPKIAAEKFYKALLKVDRWQSLPLTRAAQRVQRSAYPNAYAKWEDDARHLVDKLTGGAANTPADAATVGPCAQVNQVTSGGWVRPVKAPVGSGFRTASRPSHHGVDLSAGRGTPIVVAAAGTVIHMECDRSEIGYNCNRDGSPSTPGCGWYLDIRHSGGIITRYCHMLRRPLVTTGDKVTAGQQIGVVGTSGHSSGPHLHFEVHRGSRDSSSATDPVKFMKDHGAPLGTSDRGGETST